MHHRPLDLSDTPPAISCWYFEDLSQLAMASPHGKAVKAKRINLHGELDMVRDSYMRESWPFDFDELGEMLTDEGAMYGNPSPDALLPTDSSHYSLGYTPSPGPGWCALLTLHSHAAFGWQWHDGDKLMVFIEADKLAARDFSQLTCDAG